VSKLLNDLLISLVLTSLILLSLGTYGKYRRQKSRALYPTAGLGVAGDTNKASTIKFNIWTASRIARRSVGTALPFVATLQLGGLVVSALVLVAISSGLVTGSKEHFDLSHIQGWKRLLAKKPWTLAYSGLVCIAAKHYISTSWPSSMIGIMAMVASTFLCSPPYLVEAVPGSSFMSPPPSAKSTSTVLSAPWDATETSFPLSVRTMSSPLIASTEATFLTLISGAFTVAAAGMLYPFCGLLLMAPEPAAVLLLVSFTTIGSLLGIEICIFGEAPLALVTGLAAAILGNTLMFSNIQPLWQIVLLGAMAFMAVQLDVDTPETSLFVQTYSSAKKKLNRHRNRNFSASTKVLLQSTERYSLLHGILDDKDSRRIFYFMLLNLSFMLVQSTYGVLTGSLGLISDSIHMFFDCFALLVGLCAAVMSKWPPSVKYPYGYGKLDTLAGFGNGIFLMLISIEIIWEAVERLVEGSDVSRTMELLIVSSLGLGVNLVGIMAFDHGHGHGHAGHDHGNEGPSHSHVDHTHAHSSHSPSSAPPTTKSEHINRHGGDNMYGIYLHIMADALGSVAVVISTLCVRYFGWSGFDPLASCAIAILIFASAVPLVLSSGKKLLLSLPGDVEYTLRDVLAGISTIRGVVGYAAPKFWLDDIGKKDSAHEHHHHDHNAQNHHHGHDEHAHIQEHPHTHHHHDSDHSHLAECEKPAQAIFGVIHVIASQQADLEDVRTRIGHYLRSKNMDILVQLERDGDVRCWCGGGQKLG
jgi:solute carrier family 30 (zinc transporter), member 5/7